MTRLWSSGLYYSNLLLSLGLALVIGYATSSLIWQIQHPLHLPNQLSSKALITERSMPKQYDWSVLLQQHWFGKKPETTAQTTNKANTAPVLDRNTAPETRLKLDLKGTLFSTNPQLATAIIAGPDGKARVYRPERTLPSGVVLDTVHPDKVVLRRQQGHDQQYETLKMKSKQTSLDSSIKKTNTPPLALGDIRSQVLRNPSDLGKWLRLKPMKTQGKFQGYMISPGRDKRLLAQLDLKTGDVITRINGIALTGNLQSLGALQKLQTARELQLDLVRKGKPLSVSFRF